MPADGSSVAPAGLRVCEGVLCEGVLGVAGVGAGGGLAVLAVGVTVRVLAAVLRPALVPPHLVHGVGEVVHAGVSGLQDVLQSSARTHHYINQAQHFSVMIYNTIDTILQSLLICNFLLL